MKRVMAVMLVFALLTGFSGVNEVSLGADQGEATTPKHRREIAERVAKIPPHSVVEIEQTDEKEFKAVLLDVTPDAITVSLLEEPNRGTKVSIPIGDIEDIEQVRGRALRNTLIVLGITGAVLVALVGACAASLDVSPRPQSPASPAPATRSPRADSRQAYGARIYRT
jgi:hypothetical protein